MMSLMISLCCLVSAACTLLLLRSYMRLKLPRLFWIAMCFLGFTLENAILFADLILLPEIDLAPLRYMFSIAGIICLSMGFWEEFA